MKPLPAPHSSKDQLKPKISQVMVVSPIEMIDLRLFSDLLRSVGRHVLLRLPALRGLRRSPTCDETHHHGVDDVAVTH